MVSVCFLIALGVMFGQCESLAGNAFFSVRQRADGRWTLVDPNGMDFFLRGVDHLTYDGFKDGKTGLWNYRDSNDIRFGGDREVWVSETLDRLTAWGINTLGSGHAPELQHKGLYHVGFLGIGSFRPEQEYRIPPRFPNVFHPEWPSFCDEIVKLECEAEREDPDLIGYFFGNELYWWGDGKGDRWEYGLFYAASILPNEHSAKQALLDYTGGKTNVSDAVKEGFIRLCAERYFSVISAAIKKYDPNHLLLGCRFMGGPEGGAIPAVWEVCGKYCDVVSVNVYPHVDLETGEVRKGRLADAPSFCENYQRVSEMAKKPLLVSEWSFIGLDAGLPCTIGSGTRYATQADRAAATERFLQELRACPFIVGADYFMWVDEPAGGLSEGSVGEDCNYGLVNEAGTPYAEQVAAFRRTRSTYNDLNESRQVVTGYWDTRKRLEVSVDDASAVSSAEVSSSRLSFSAFSSVRDICVMPLTGLLFYIR